MVVVKVQEQIKVEEDVIMEKENKPIDEEFVNTEQFRFKRGAE